MRVKQVSLKADYRRMSLTKLGEKLSDVHWRLSNLYKIVNKHGEVVTFVPNAAQLDSIETRTMRDVTLKCRQRGITTLECIIALDECLFNDNWNAGIMLTKKTTRKRYSKQR